MDNAQKLAIDDLQKLCEKAPELFDTTVEAQAFYVAARATVPTLLRCIAVIRGLDQLGIDCLRKSSFIYPERE
jgi:hypothetical protein